MASVDTASSVMPAKSASVWNRIDSRSRCTSMESGSPLARAASGCSQVMMLPRSMVRLGALWNGTRLGRCRRTATSSSPRQPTLPASRARCRRHLLREDPEAVLFLEAVRRPGERRESGQRADVVRLEAQVHVAPALAARRADRGHPYARPFVVGAHVVPVESGGRIERQRRIAEGHQRRHRRVHVDRGRTVEVEVDVLLVLVLRR